MIRLVAWLFVATALRGCLASDYNYKPPITYAGPIVYSDEKPPIISFPGPPAHSYKGGSGGGSYGYGDSKGPNSITYVPLPLDDLPILIYQSKNKPPIHLINRPAKDSSYSGGSSSYGSSTAGYSTQNYGGGGNTLGYGSESGMYTGASGGYGSSSSAGSYSSSSSTSGYNGGGYGGYAPAPPSYNAPPSPKPVFVPKPSTPSAVYLPQVKPQYSSGGGTTYGMNSGGYGGSGYYNNVGSGERPYSSGSSYGGSMNYNNGGGYGASSSSSSSTTSTSSYGGSSSYNPPPPPHIVYSGHPPIHVYQQPSVYNQPSSNYGSGPTMAESGYGGSYGDGKPSGYAPPSSGYGGKPYNQGYGYGGKPSGQSYGSKPSYAPEKHNYVAAPAGYHKPPIIIYQGIRPPVHVYRELASSYEKPSYGSSAGSYEATYGGSYESGAPSYAAYSAKNGDEWEPLKRQKLPAGNGASFNEKIDTDIDQEQTEALPTETDNDFTTEQESESAAQ